MYLCQEEPERIQDSSTYRLSIFEAVIDFSLEPKSVTMLYFHPTWEALAGHQASAL